MSDHCMITTMPNHLVFTEQQVQLFSSNGYVLLEDMMTEQEIEHYRRLYDDFLDGTIDCTLNRSDLGGDAVRTRADVENVTQIMWPSDFVSDLPARPYHRRALAGAKQLIGNEAAFDFDMLIDKAPHTNTPTPWHQDAAYWIKLEDNLAVSCWLALDDCAIDNGCMWYIPEAHRKPLRRHREAGGGGGALQCEASETEGIPVACRAGSSIWHHGMTPHYSRGNSTATKRRAFIINFRPENMIRYERRRGFDHGRTNNNRTIKNPDAHQI